jgi:hypothetical protein
MVLLDDGHCLSGQALDVCPARKRQYGRRIFMAWRQSFARDTDVQLLAELIRDCLPTPL